MNRACLRFSVSALSLVTCVLSIALWVRSQRTADALDWHNGWGIGIGSFDGRIELMINSGKTDFPNMERGFSYNAYPDIVWAWGEPTRYGFATNTGPPGVYFLQLPHWFLGLLAALAAAAPWIHWHFSLRTLLFAITLIALLTGILVVSN